MLFVLFIVCLLSFSRAANPECTWACDDPVCQANCKAVCQPPVCTYLCTGTGGHPTCVEPRCHVQCHNVTDSSPSDNCPSCETHCQPLICQAHDPSVTCEILCQAPECGWHCEKPKPWQCQKPRCELQCEHPTCEVNCDNGCNTSGASWLSLSAGVLMAVVLIET